MRLILESKRMWLLSYMICMAIPVAFYFFLWDYPIARTVGFMLFTIQPIMFIFFFLILLLKWKAYCRTVVAIIYLAMTIYEGVNGYLEKWYIIAPLFVVTVIYMLWNLGGVVNCVIVSPYQDRIDEKIREGRYSYDLYVRNVDEYNERNDLRSFSKVRKKKEPNWERVKFDSSGLKMFYFEVAMIGIDVSLLKQKEKQLNRINKKISDKNDALYNNLSIFDEKNSLDTIRAKAKSVGLDTLGYDKSKDKLERLRKKNLKEEKKILRKRL